MKTFTTLFIGICLTINSFGQIVREGNIAKYYFNEGNANDDVGINDGIIFGAILEQDRFENEEHSFSFNNSYIRIDHDEILDLGNSEFSISAWFKTEVDDRFMVIFNKGEGTTVEPRIFIRTMENPENTFQWRVGDGVNNVTSTYTDPLFFDNEWHHVVLIRETNSISFYLDANLIDETSDMNLPFINTNSNRPILLGVQDSIMNSSIPLGNYFEGQLDDFRIYNRAINALEVDSLFNESEPSIMTSTQNQDNKFQFSIRPNPVFEYIELGLPYEFNSSYDYAIYSNIGQLIYKGTQRQSRIDLESLPKGVYYIKISKDRMMLGAKRFVKMN